MTRNVSLEVVPLERLTSIDIRHLADWIAKDWRGEEWAMTRRLIRLRRTLEQLPDPYRARALEAYAVLERARVANGHPWRAALEQIKIAGIDWECQRPPLEVCGVGKCQIAYRDPARLADHRALIHGAAA